MHSVSGALISAQGCRKCPDSGMHLRTTGVLRDLAARGNAIYMSRFLRAHLLQESKIQRKSVLHPGLQMHVRIWQAAGGAVAPNVHAEAKVCPKLLSWTSLLNSDWMGYVIPPSQYLFPH